MSEASNKFWYGNNDLVKQEGKIIVGLRTKIKSKNPGHSEIINIVKFLPAIIQKLHDKFPCQFSRSGNFFLNVDDDELNDPVFLAMIPRGRPEGDVPEYDYLGINDEQSEVTDIESELTLSEYDSDRFKKKYRAEIYN